MVSSPRFDRFNRSRRRHQNRSNPEQALSRAIANALTGNNPVRSESRSRKTHRIDVGQLLESRLLLSNVSIDISPWPGTNLLLVASGDANNATWTLRNRDTNQFLASAAIDNVTDSFTITGSAQGDNLHIDGSAVFNVNAQGTVTTRLPAPSWEGSRSIDAISGQTGRRR